MGYGPQRGHFITRKRVRVDRRLCVGCQLCMKFCPVGDVIRIDGKSGQARVVNPVSCGGCYLCMERCPSGAIRPVVVKRKGLIDYSKPQFQAPGQFE